MVLPSQSNLRRAICSDLLPSGDNFSLGETLVALPKELPAKFKVFSYGLNEAHNDSPFIYDLGSFPAILEDFNQRGKDMLIDYEHVSMIDPPPTDGAPAAGWIKALEDVPGDGLYAVVREWTQRAAAMIKAGEYKYFSPVIVYDKITRAIRGLTNIALTNEPHLNNLIPLAARDKYIKTWYASSDKNQNFKQGEKEMDLLKKILAALGLDEKATEDQAIKKLTEVKGNADKLAAVSTELDTLKATVKTMQEAPAVAACKEVLAELGITDPKAPAEMVVAACKEIKKTQPADAALIKQLADRLNVLEGTIITDKSEILIQQALSTGRTSKAEVDTFGRKLAKENPALFNQIVMVRPEYSVVPLKDLQKNPDKKETTSLSETTQKVAELMGVSKETIEKFGPK